MQTRSTVRKQKIVAAARELLAQHGYDGMTVAMVAKRAKSALGSVTHFYPTKAALAAAVAEGMLVAMVSQAETALQSAGADIAEAVRRLIGAALKWQQTFPEYGRLLGFVDIVPEGGRSNPSALQSRLEPILEGWARPLVALGRVEPLTPAQFYAVLVAPALTRIGRNRGRDTARGEVDWLEFLSLLAMKALVPPKPKRNAKNPASSSEGATPDLPLFSPNTKSS